MRIGRRHGRGEIESWSGIASWFYNLFNRDPASNEAIVRFAGVGEGDRVLDIGCGPGAALEHARDAGASVTGIDPTPGMIKLAGDRVPEATLVQGSAEYLEFDANSFTHVWSMSAYHHWAYPETAIDQILEVLRPGGRVFLSEHKLKDGKTGHGINAADAQEVASLLENHGFVDTSVEVMPAGRKDYLVVSGTKPVV